MNVVVYISVLLLAGYVMLILVYLAGWLLIPAFKSEAAADAPIGFSILVPARNEEHAITDCLRSIIIQHYDLKHYEVLVLNDYSTDRTEEVVNEFINANPQYPVRLVNMRDDPQQRRMKKAAIDYGISLAVNSYIVLTDADCDRGPYWLKTISAYISRHRSKLIYAPVCFTASNYFERMQALEFAGLVGIGASAIRLKYPNMCSAANLIFEKEVFLEVGGYKGKDGIASGDDEFLMHKVFRKHQDRVHFLKHRDAIVYTHANASIKQLSDQRRRWVSKSTKYEDRYITAILVAAYVFNALLVFNLFFHAELGWIMLAVKAAIEAVFLFPVLRFFRRTHYLVLLPLAELFHILYVLIIGIWANMGRYNWKGREVK